MPRDPIDLTPLRDVRGQLSTVAGERARIDADILARRAEVEAARRRGASAQAVGRLEARLGELQREQRGLVERRRGLAVDLDRLSDEFVRDRDPATLAESLDGGRPIALCPVRLETRYVADAGALRIRVYPDVLNVMQHTSALTGEERGYGVRYWTARFAGRTDEAERVVRDMSLVYRRSRAQWIIRVLAPTNLDHQGEAGVAPAFPDVVAIDARAKSTRAVLLPDRWCAIGYGAGRREVFRVWGRRIPDELPMSPDWLAVDDRRPLFEDDRRWLIDFDAARDQGMALEVTQADVDAFLAERHAPAFSLRGDVIERLLVVGLDWTLDPASAAAQLADLLAGHRDSRGLGFVPLGTPTNNTSDQPSGYRSSDELGPPQESDAADGKDALELLIDTFGLPAEQLPPDGIHNAHLPEQRTALHMMNVLWRGTFGHYLAELWNPQGAKDSELFMKPQTLESLRRYAVSYVRPGGPLPVLRIGRQPYGLLPVTGKGFVDAGDSPVERGISTLVGMLRPMWELASRKVQLLADGDVVRAKDILQTGPWSQTAFHRDEDPVVLCHQMSPFGPSKELLMQQILGLFGISQYWLAPMSCHRFLPDPPYTPGYLAGVPWVLADAIDPKVEAPGTTMFKDEQSYLLKIADALELSEAEADVLLNQYQDGPSLLQALTAYSASLDKHDAAVSFASRTRALTDIMSRATPVQVNIEPPADTAVSFEVRTPKELSSIVIPALTGQATLGQHIARSLGRLPRHTATGSALVAGDALYGVVDRYVNPLRDMAAVQMGLRFLARRSVGELNVAFRTTLDTFSYRLDAWITARANRRLQQIRGRQPDGVHIGAFAWVENLKADLRPDSDGYVLAPSLGQAATAAILRSGFEANHQQGAFNIHLDSQRSRRALGLLQGLTRDQPLAALYGYRIERALRDALLGKLIWPLRLAFPYRPAGAAPKDEPAEAVAARDVVDGVALLEAWENPAATWNRLESVTVEDATAGAGSSQPFLALDAGERKTFEGIVAGAQEMADAVSDLLMAEGMHQIVQGNFERAGAAMAVADKQALPIEPQVSRTPRGGVMYTQRVAVLCPASAGADWPADVRSRAEPRLNAWLASMLDAPGRYRFSATVHRAAGATKIHVDWADLGCSPIAAVLSATAALTPAPDGAATGFRKRLVDALAAQIADPQNVLRLEIEMDGVADRLGLAAFEALATTLRQLIDKIRPLTRKDLVLPQDDIEQEPSKEGEYPGVDLDEIRGRADAVIAAFKTSKNAVRDSAGADGLLTALHEMEEFLQPASWPQEVVAIDAAGSDAATRDHRATVAKRALNAALTAKLERVTAAVEPPEGRSTPTNGQSVQHAIDQIKELLGHDFPVLPVFALGDYVTAFNASLAQQDDLTLKRRRVVSGWLVQLARVRDGVDRLAGALSAHAALLGVGDEEEFAVIQYPHRSKQVWAALPEAWTETGMADPATTHEELRAYMTRHPDAPFKDPNRDKPALALALHISENMSDGLRRETALAGFSCDEWQESIPDPYQTAGIGFHYDAPGARPPQTVILAVPPVLEQDRWHFDEVVDVVHEAADLARLRAVRPRDLDSGLGALLPANYLPQNYTDELPSVRLLEMSRRALREAITPSGLHVYALGKL